MEMDKRRVVLIGLVILAVITAGVFLYLSKKQVSDQPINQGTGTTIEKLEPTSLPANLPANMPMEAGSEILDNYQAVAKDGRVQGTRRFTTKKTPDIALRIYTEFFSKSAWKIVNQKQEPGSASAILRRNDSVLTINVKRDSAVNSNVVEITITEPQEQGAQQ